MTQKQTLRADAERNRQRIIDAAAELFAAKGLSVGLDEIAHHAGVGVGTAYRRFPDKGRLIEALFEERVDRIVEAAEAGLAANDPWEGLAGFLERATELQIANRGLRELIFGSEHGAALAPRARAKIAPLVEQLVRRAQGTGVLREDIVAADLPLLQFIVSSSSELTTREAPDLWRRYLALVLDGLRTPNPHPLPERGLSPDELDAVIREAAGR
jgi:AcrR family transcriptional regulator